MRPRTTKETMWSSAVSVALAAIALAVPSWAQPSGPVRIGPAPIGIPQRSRRLADQAQVWERVRLSLLVLDCGGRQRGVAALIDPRGFFLAHSSCATARELLGRTAGGRLVVLRLKGQDEATQLALFEASGLVDPRVPVIRVATDEPRTGAQVIAATASGPIRGEVVAGNRIGNFRPSLRYVPLFEFKFETPLDKVGGALVFDSGGDLLGVLGATLASNQDVSKKSPANVQAEVQLRAGAACGKLLGPEDGVGKGPSQGAIPRRGGPGGAPTNPRVAMGLSQSQFGPVGLMVGYALGPEILQRVVDGFRSPEHKVEHPSIGVFFRGVDGGRKGAFIESVLPDSPAARAGVVSGDVITRADGQLVDGPTDLAVLLFRQRVGRTVKLTLQRGDETRVVEVAVGAQDVTRKSLRNQRN